jgi:hypothetical protein
MPVRAKGKRPTPQGKSAPSVPALLIGLGSLILIAVAGFALWINRSGSTANFTPEVNGASKLKADKNQVDLGDVKLGQTVTVSFEITNTGDQPLRFSDVPYVEVVEGC